jgi:hypothetical protein
MRDRAASHFAALVDALAETLFGEVAQRSKCASSYVAALVLEMSAGVADLPYIMSNVNNRTVMRAFPIGE